MSKLDELIKELCPNGVEYKKLGEVCNFQNGFAFKSTLFKENGEAILRITNISNGIINEEDLKYFLLGDYKENLGNYIVSKNDIVIAMSGATTGKIGINNTSKKFYLNQRVGKFIPNIVKLNNRFLYHFLLSKGLEILKISSVSGAQPNLSTENIKNLVIPVPPLEVQEEIAKILDNYTKSVEELKEKLNEELIARKNQYSWYRDYLLKFENKVKIVKLKDIATEMYRGNGIKREEIREIGIPCIRYGEIYTDYGISFEKTKSYTDENLIINKKYIDYGDILFAITGESVEEIGKSTAYIGKEKCLVGGDILVMKHKQDPVYLSYVLSTENAQKQKSKGKIKSKVVHTNATDIGEIEIPLPPLEVQKRIVEVLDNFEKICNDLNIGLPAEIEARQKQYEFIRNYLLTFNNEEVYDLSKQASKQAQNLIKILQYVYGYVEVRLGDIGSIVRGNGLQKKDFTEDGVGCIHYGQIYTKYGMVTEKTISFVEESLAEKLRKVEKGDIIFAVTSENIEDLCKCVVWLGEEKIVTGGHTAILKHNQNSKFLAYYFQTEAFHSQKRKMATGTKVMDVTATKLEEILIPLPSLEEQQRIVDILDRFDKLCNDISEGLPAEIEARQKQYEYYREKLLTFKNIND